MKAKVKAALEGRSITQIYGRRKIDGESVFGHIKDNQSFRRFYLRDLEKMHTEFGIVGRDSKNRRRKRKSFSPSVLF